MVATIISGGNRVVLPDDMRTALGLEDGIEYVVARTHDDGVLRPVVSDEVQTRTTGEPGPASAEQLAAVERMLATRRRFTGSRVLADDDWDAAIGRATVEDFLSGDVGNETGPSR